MKKILGSRSKILGLFFIDFSVESHERGDSWMFKLGRKWCINEFAQLDMFRNRQIFQISKKYFIFGLIAKLSYQFLTVIEKLLCRIIRKALKLRLGSLLEGRRRNAVKKTLQIYQKLGSIDHLCAFCTSCMCCHLISVKTSFPEPD